ncbi:hypothetical protein P4O66_020175, partial [Electrophorus voltai]
RNMSMSVYKHDEGKAGRSSQVENEESVRNLLRGEGNQQDEFALESADPAHMGNPYMRKALLSGRRSKPKLVSAQAVLFSRLEPEFIQEEPAGTVAHALETPQNTELKVKRDSIPRSAETNIASDGKPTDNEGVTQNMKERNTTRSLIETGEVSRKSLWLAGHRERWRGKRREKLGGSVENIAEDVMTTEKEMSRVIRMRHPRKHYESTKKQDEEYEREGGERQAEQGRVEGEADTRRVATHRIFSRVLAHSFVSSSSSSSSSFNCSSAESDDVFSEGEETVRKNDMRRDLVECSTAIKVPSIAHVLQGNIQQGEGGKVLKKFNVVEDTCLQALMSDPLHLFVPRYYGNISRNGERYIRLEDLLSGLRKPAIMDCKMGIRTYQEEEIIKAKTKGSLRSDMYQKMENVDPTAPTAEEQAQRGVTKLRYMQWRDSTSSTSTLGLRIEGIMMENGTVLREFNKTRTKAQVTETLLFFTKRQVHILKAYVSRLEALRETLKESSFFNTHEIIGSSLLFLHDQTCKANIWMIDFGKTIPAPENVYLKHDVPWVEGNREDGYLTGLTSLISLLHAAIREAAAQSLENHHPDHRETDTLMKPLPGENESTPHLVKKTKEINHLS